MPQKTRTTQGMKTSQKASKLVKSKVVNKKKKPQKQKASELSTKDIQHFQSLTQINQNGLKTFISGLHSSGFKEYVDYLHRPWRVFFTNLMAGIARGFGFFVGATVVVAMFAYITSQYLVQLPVVGEFFELVQQVIVDPELQEGARSGQINSNLQKIFKDFKANVLQNELQ